MLTHWQVEVDCGDCNGTGILPLYEPGLEGPVDYDNCDICGGSGRLYMIPAGVCFMNQPPTIEQLFEKVLEEEKKNSLTFPDAWYKLSESSKKALNKRVVTEKEALNE